MHVGPVVGITKGSVRLVCTEMAEGVMCKAKQSFAEVVDMWNEQLITDVPEVVHFVPARHGGDKTPHSLRA
jgi:hypothetical protein